MKHAVIYLGSGFPSQMRILREALGYTPEWSPVMPIVSRPIADEQELSRILELLDRLTQGSHWDPQIMAQPDENSVPRLTFEAAMVSVRANEALHDFLLERSLDEKDLLVRAADKPRCWLIAVHSPEGGIPPGLGFVVDKHSSIAMSRRWIDVVPLLEE